MKILTNENAIRRVAKWMAVALGCMVTWMVLGSLIASAWAAPPPAQNAKLDLSQLDKLAKKASQVADVNLEGPMLKLAAETMASKEPKGKAAAVPGMLQQLKGIYVRAFEFSKPGEYSKADLESLLKQVESGGWKPVVNAKEEKSGESAHIYIMEEGGEAVGLVIVAAEPKELAVVNLVGPINFSQLGGLGGLGALGQLGALGGVGNSTPQLQHRDQPNPPHNSK
jgi:Domain of unknown function (DUF4252)